MNPFGNLVRHRQRVVRVPVQGKTWKLTDSGEGGTVDLMHVLEEPSGAASRTFFRIPRHSSLSNMIGKGDQFKTSGHKVGFRDCVVRKGFCLQDGQSCRRMSCSFIQVLTAFSAQMSGDAQVLDSRDGVSNHFFAWDKQGNLVLVTLSVEAERWSMLFRNPFAPSVYVFPGDRILYSAPV